MGCLLELLHEPNDHTQLHQMQVAKETAAHNTALSCCDPSTLCSCLTADRQHDNKKML